jgi:hypothetical protein
LLSGADGGNVAGNLSRNIDMGPLANTITGALGGGVGGYILTGLPGLAPCGRVAWTSPPSSMHASPAA